MPNSLRCKIKHLCHNGTLTERERDRILKALKLIPDNATNGDVIRVLFSSSEVREIIDDLVHYTLDGYIGNYTTKEWWNAPYKAESEVEASSSNFIQLKQDILNNKQLWRKLREIEDEDSD